MLQVNPRMLSQLGEIEGIDMTLTFVRGKQAEVARLNSRRPVALGFPTPRPHRE
jgi:hypothetical protein